MEGFLFPVKGTYTWGEKKDVKRSLGRQQGWNMAIFGVGIH